MSLRSTIRQIQTRDEDIVAIHTDRELFISGWKSDLLALYETIRAELKDLEDENLIRFKLISTEISEEQVGDYEVPMLRILASSREIFAQPIARLTAGGAGRVDLFRSDRPSENDRVRIIRSISENGTLYWQIETKNLGDASALIRALPSFGMVTSRNYAPLWKDKIEGALDYLLQL